MTTLTEGTILGGSYRVLRPIGTGGMGEVYEVEHTRLPRRFAVKVLRCEAEPELLTRFQQEAEITSRLVHPHIVEVVDCSVSDARCPYLVMELLEGEDLGQRLRRQGRLPLDEVARIARQVGSALAATHRHGVVHRDLKPKNLFLARTAEGEKVKVLDFGVSKLQGAGPGLTREHAIVGSPRYMAPEQALGRNDRLDGRTDIFALGAILYELIAGVPAFGAEAEVEVLHQVVYDDPRPLSQVDPSLPEEVSAVIARSLAKEPAQRYQSALALAEDLEAALVYASTPPRAGSTPGSSAGKDAPTQLDRPTPRVRAGEGVDGAWSKADLAVVPARTARSPRWVWVLVAAGGVSLLASPMLWLLSRRASTREPPAAVHGVVRLQLSLTPSSATVLWDGAPRSDRPLLVPRDQGEHHLEVRADGHASEARVVVPSSDLQLSFELSRVVVVDAGVRPAAVSTSPRPPAQAKPTHTPRVKQPPLPPRDHYQPAVEEALAQIPVGRYRADSGAGLRFDPVALTVVFDGRPKRRLKPTPAVGGRIELYDDIDRAALVWNFSMRVLMARPKAGVVAREYHFAGR